MTDGGRGVAPNQSLHAAGFGDDNFSGAQAFVEREKFAGGITLCGNNGKYGEIAVANGIEHFVSGRGDGFSRVRFALIPRDYNGDDHQDR